MCKKTCEAQEAKWEKIPGPEGSTCCGATKSMGRNYFSLCNLEPVLCKKRSHDNEKPLYRN